MSSEAIRPTGVPLVDTALGLARLVQEADSPFVGVDAGFHVGGFTSTLLAGLPTTRILAFEPDPESCAAGRKAFASRESVVIREAALGAEEGRAEFFRGPMSMTNSLKPRPAEEGRPYFPQSATLSGGTFIEVETLDKTADAEGIDHINLLKLDLQGGELDALEGARALLETGRIDVCLSEVTFVPKYVDQPLFWKLWGFMESVGYSLHSVHDIKVGLYHDEPESLRQAQWNQADAIFISPAVRRALDA